MTRLLKTFLASFVLFFGGQLLIWNKIRMINFSNAWVEGIVFAVCIVILAIAIFSAEKVLKEMGVISLSLLALYYFMPMLPLEDIPGDSIVLKVVSLVAIVIVAIYLLYLFGFFNLLNSRKKKIETLEQVDENEYEEE